MTGEGGYVVDIWGRLGCMMCVVVRLEDDHETRLDGKVHPLNQPHHVWIKADRSDQTFFTFLANTAFDTQSFWMTVYTNELHSLCCWNDRFSRSLLFMLVQQASGNNCSTLFQYTWGRIGKQPGLGICSHAVLFDQVRRIKNIPLVVIVGAVCFFMLTMSEPLSDWRNWINSISSSSGAVWYSHVKQHCCWVGTDLKLTKAQKEKLVIGFEVQVATPTHPRSQQTETEFENIFGHVENLTWTSDDKASWFKAKLVNIYEMLTSTPIRQQCCLTRQHYIKLRQLEAIRGAICA